MKRITWRGIAVKLIVVGLVGPLLAVQSYAQTRFYGYYDSANFPGHGPPDNYTNQFVVNFSDDPAVANAALQNGQRLQINTLVTSIGLDPNDPGGVPNALAITAYKWQAYNQAGLVDFVYPIDEPYSQTNPGTGLLYTRSDLDAIIDLYDQSMPGYKTGLNFTGISTSDRVFQPGFGVPTGLDFAGMTYYPFYSGGATDQASFNADVGPILNAMRAVKSPSQKMYLVGQSFSELGFTQPPDQSPHWYAATLINNPDVVGISWFKYGSTTINLTGAVGYPTLVAQIKSAGQTDLGISATPAPLAVPADFKAGLIDQWTFNNVTPVVGGTVSSDGGEIGLKGTFTNSAPGIISTQGGGNMGLDMNTPNPASQRVNFLGSNRYGEGSLDQVTVEAWVRQTATPSGTQAIFSKGTDLFLGIDDDGGAGNGFLVGGFDGALRAPLTANAWHHVAYTVDGTDGPGGDMERIFINGVEVASRVSQWNGIVDSNSDVNIGWRSGGANRFRGIIDEVRVHDTALSGTQIANSFATGPVVPNPISLQVIASEDFEGFSPGDPITNGADWISGLGQVVNSPGVLGFGEDDGHGLVLRLGDGLSGTTTSSNKWNFGEVPNDVVYFSFDLFMTNDSNRNILFDLQDNGSDTVYTAMSFPGTDQVDHVENSGDGNKWGFESAIDGHAPVDYDLPVNDWMHVEIIVDQVNDTFDLLIGGQVLIDDGGLWNLATSVDLLNLESSPASSAYVDNLVVGVLGLLGDFNSDGKVDAADYTVWRDLGSSTLPNDGGAADMAARYALWVNHFGDTAMAGGSGSAATGAVPEPGTLALAALGLVLAGARCRRSWPATGLR